MENTRAHTHARWLQGARLYAGGRRSQRYFNACRDGLHDTYDPWDILPLSPVARSLVLEALVGQLFPVIFDFARLVAMEIEYHRSRQPRTWLAATLAARVKVGDDSMDRQNR